MDRSRYNGRPSPLLHQRLKQVDHKRLSLPLVLLALYRLVAQPGSRLVLLQRLSSFERQLWLVLRPELQVVLGLTGQLCQQLNFLAGFLVVAPGRFLRLLLQHAHAVWNAKHIFYSYVLRVPNDDALLRIAIRYVGEIALLLFLLQPVSVPLKYF